MQPFLRHSTKYDGSLHYRYPLDVIDQTDSRLVTFSRPGVPIESYRGSWPGQRNILSFFWRGRPYVLHVVWLADFQPHELYVDITTQTQWDDRSVRYVDLDLDLIVRQGSDVVHLDDQEEFEAHRQRWSYPPELVKECWEGVESLRGLFASQTTPFSKAMFDWRPGNTSLLMPD